MRSTIGILMLVSFGCSAADQHSAAVCSPLAAAGQLDTQAAGTLVVAPDERHIAFLRDPHMIDAGCLARGAQLELGTLVVLDVQSDASACQRVLAHDVLGYSIYFSSDSQDLVFMDSVDDCGVGNLKAAASDGSHVRLVYPSVTSEVGIGSTVFFAVKGGNENLAAPMAEEKWISLGSRGDLDYPEYAANATGTAYASTTRGTGYRGAADGSLVLVALPSGASRILVDGATENVGNRVWSPRGGWLAFCHGPREGKLASLSVVAADGGTRIDVSTNSACYEFSFSPDDAWLLYPELDDAGGTRLLTYSLTDRSSVALGTMPAGYFALTFSDDGKSVVALLDPPNTFPPAIHVATTATAGSLRLVVDRSLTLRDTASAGGYVAIPVDYTNSTVEVYPVSGGPPVTVAGGRPQFEPGVSAPRLLLRSYPPSALVTTATDGSAPTTLTVTDFISFAAWLGPVAVGGTKSDASRLLTLWALTAAGPLTSPLATEIGEYAWAPIPAPTRLYYSRAVASAGGPVGVFSLDLPR